ncbi:hypothetical protein, partial [Thauera aromatica]|uniref:hypothetical protein n=1 Tax=Thauera aromatica TaxID=59405 RepID=UPI001FFDAE91
KTPPVIVTGRRFHLPIALCGPSRYVTTGTSNRVITLTVTGRLPNHAGMPPPLPVASAHEAKSNFAVVAFSSGERNEDQA